MPSGLFGTRQKPRLHFASALSCIGSRASRLHAKESSMAGCVIPLALQGLPHCETLLCCRVLSSGTPPPVDFSTHHCAILLLSCSQQSDRRQEGRCQRRSTVWHLGLGVFCKRKRDATYFNKGLCNTHFRGLEFSLPKDTHIDVR